jgi:hypothetical protein
MNKMNRETQKWLREFVRTEFPYLVARATFYYQVSGIKFWLSASGGRSSKSLASQITARLKLKAPSIALEVKVYVGVVPGTHANVIKIMDKASKDPKLEPFKAMGRQVPASPARLNRNGFDIEDYCVGATPFTGKKPPPDPAEVRLHILEKLNEWKTKLDRIDGQSTVASGATCRALAADIQVLRRQLENSVW